MQLSILVPVYKQAKVLRKFLNAMQHQDAQDFEIVIVLDSNIENNLAVLDSFRLFFKNRIALVYNTRRIGRTKALQEAIEKASSEYVLITSSSNFFARDAVSQLLKLIKNKPADIIEFRAPMRSPISFKGKIRQNQPQQVNLVDRPEVVAYSYPFDFNKIYRREILSNSSLEAEIRQTVNSRFAINFFLSAWGKARTYVNSDLKIVRLRNDLFSEVTPLSIAKQWVEWRKAFEKNGPAKYAAELDYLSFYHLSVILAGFVTATDNARLKEKYRQFLQNQWTTTTNLVLKPIPTFAGKIRKLKRFARRLVGMNILSCIGHFKLSHAKSK